MRIIKGENLEVKITADASQFSKELSGMNKSMQTLSKGVGSKMQSIGKGITDIGKKLTQKVTLPIVGIGAAISKVGIDFEKSMSEVQAVTGASAQEMEVLEKAARNAGATTDKSASEAADALKYMGLAGWSVADSQKALMPVLKLSSAANMDLGRTSDLVTDTMSALSLEVNDLDRYLDVLAQTSRKSNTDVDQLGEALLVVGGKATNLGVPVEELSAMLGVLANNGIKGSEAGTGLNAILTNLTAPTGRAKKALDELNISAFDSSGNFKGLEEIMMEVQDATKGMTQEQKEQYLSMIAGKEHGDVFNAMLKSLGGEYQDLEADIYGSKGAMDEMYGTSVNNTMGAINELKSSIEELALSLFEHLQPVIEKMVEVVQGLVDKFNSLDNEQKENVVKWLAIAAAVGPILVVFGKIVSIVGTIGGALMKLKGLLVAAQAGMAAAGAAGGTMGAGIAALTWPIALAIAAIAGLVVGGVALVNYFRKDAIPAAEEFGDEVSDTTADAVNNFMTLADAADSSFKQIAWSGQEVTSEMAEVVIGNYQAMTDGVVSELESERDQALAIRREQLANNTELSEEEKEEKLRILEESYNKEIESTQAGQARIDEIMRAAAEEGRALKESERQEIEKISQGMKDDAVRVLSESEQEQMAIMETLSHNKSIESANQAADIVKKAKEEKDGVITEAEEKYNDAMKIAAQLRADGTKEAIAEADAIVAEAQREKDETIKLAEERHEKIIDEAKAQAADHVDAVDWETGEVLSNWDIFKRDVSKKYNEIKDNAKKAWNDMRDDISEKWNGMKDTISEAITNAKKKVTDTIDGIKGSMSNTWDNVKTTASSKWDEIKSTILKPIESAKTKIKEIIDDIKEFFSGLKLKLPDIKMPKLPKFSITGKFGLNPLSVPKLSVNWNHRGGIFKKPTVLNNGQGVGDASNGGGSAAEVVAPLSDLKQMLGLEDGDKGKNVTINLNGNYGFRDKDDMDYLLNELALAGRRM